LAAVIMAIVSDVVPAERRGAAAGTIMTAFSLAAVAGVPAGIVLGAHFGWAAPFLLLTGLSILIWLAALRLVPSLTSHLAQQPKTLSRVLPELWQLASNPHYLNAFALTFVMMMSQMTIIPFISPVLVANHDLPFAQLSWLYMAGGAATFFTSRLIGRLADRYGPRKVFRVLAVCSIVPILFITHLPSVSFIALLLFFPCFMVILSGRIVPLQALLTTVPAPAQRGAFLSMNSALQAFGSGCGAWLGGLMLTSNAMHQIEGYEVNGWIATGLVVFAMVWIGRVHGTARVPAVPVIKR